MSYKDFIEKFVESSSLSEKDSKLLALEMESDFYAKEKDLILNNEKDTMKKIEDDFGDKDKLAEQMFLAHHKYLNIPILGPLFYFKIIRWTIIIILFLPINSISANVIVGLLSPSVIFGAEEPINLGNMLYILGYTIPFIFLVYLFIKFKVRNNQIYLATLLSVVLIFFVSTFVFMLPVSSYSGPAGYGFLMFLMYASPYILLVLLTLAVKKLLKK